METSRESTPSRSACRSWPRRSPVSSSFPEAKGARGPDIEEVLAYLVSVNRVGDKALDAARRIATGIKRARYEPLRDEDIEGMEEARSELYGELEALLSEVEEEAPDG